MEEHEITAYGVTKLLGYDERSNTGHVKRKVSGQESISMEQLREILNIISKKAHKVICEDDIEFWVTRVKIK